MVQFSSRNCALIFLVLVQLTLLIQGAPRHHIHKLTHDTKALKKSYIDIDASDPFKVPKSSHYIDKSMPDYEKEEENAKQQEGEGVGENNQEEEPEPNLEEPQLDQEPSKEQPTEENNLTQQRNALNSDLPASLTDKISELADSKGSSNGSPIELNENDIKTLLKNHDVGDQIGEAPPQQEGEGN